MVTAFQSGVLRLLMAPIRHGVGYATMLPHNQRSQHGFAPTAVAFGRQKASRYHGSTEETSSF